MLASQGGHAQGESRTNMPGPNWATSMDSPPAISVIRTSAECPPRTLDCKPMNDIALENAVAYAAKHELRLAERLGFGIHGTVHVAEGVSNRDLSAVKAFNSPTFYARELAVYLRLHEAQLTDVLGFYESKSGESS
jgi:hypothetical protein